MKNGLKGVTDATVFCKSMQKGGAKPMIRSMKRYATGGSIEQCGPGDKFKKACKKAFKSVGKASETKGGVFSGLITAAVGTLAGLGLKKMKGQE